MLRRVLPWVAVVAVVVAAVATAGWGRSTPQAGRRSVSPQSSAAATVLSPAEAAQVVEGVLLVRTDLPAGFGPDRTRRGRVLAGPAGLRLCGATLPDTGTVLAQGRASFPGRRGSRVTDEVRVYAPGEVERFVGRLGTVASACTRPVRPTTAEQPSTLALRVVGRTGRPGRHELLVLRRGDVLSVLQVDGETAGFALDVARGLSERLQTRLPTS